MKLRRRTSLLLSVGGILTVFFELLPGSFSEGTALMVWSVKLDLGLDDACREGDNSSGVWRGADIVGHVWRSMADAGDTSAS